MDRRADIQDLEERVLREVGDEALRRRLRRIHSVWVGLKIRLWRGVIVGSVRGGGREGEGVVVVSIEFTQPLLAL